MKRQILVLVMVLVLALVLPGLLFISCSGNGKGKEGALEKALLKASATLLDLGEQEDAALLFSHGRETFSGFIESESPGERLAVAALLLDSGEQKLVEEYLKPLLSSKETKLEAMMLLFRRGSEEERYEWGCRILYQGANPLRDDELLLLGEEASQREDGTTVEEVMRQLAGRRSAFPYLLLNRYMAELRKEPLTLLCRSGELQLFLSERGEGGLGFPDIAWAGEGDLAQSDLVQSEVKQLSGLLESFINRDYQTSRKQFLQLEQQLQEGEEPLPALLTLVELLGRMEDTGSGNRNEEEDNRLLRDYLALEGRFFYSQSYYLAGARFASALGGREALFESFCEKAIALAPSSPVAQEARALLARRYRVAGFFLLPEESISLSSSPATKANPYLLSLLLPMLEASPGRFRLAAEAAILEGMKDTGGRSFLKSLLLEEESVFPGDSEGIEALRALLGSW